MDYLPSSSAPVRIAPNEIQIPKESNALELRAPTSLPLTLPRPAPPAESIVNISTRALKDKSSDDCSLPNQAAAPSSRPSPLFDTIQPEEFMASLDTWIRKYQDLPSPTPPLTAGDHLAKFAARSDGERARMIDNMICECLQDENFGKLAEDVERSWKRICLGF